MRRKFDVIGLGGCAADFLAVLPHFPGLDQRVRARSFKQQGGGEAATAMVAISRLGARAAFIGKVGADQLAWFIKKGLEEEGVDAGHLVFEKGKSSLFAFCAVEEKTGRRTIFWHKETSPLTAGELNRSFITSARILHLDQREPAAGLAASGWARKAGSLVTLDTDEINPVLERIVRNADVVLGSRELSEQLASSPARAASRLMALGPSLIVLTFGEKGCLVKTSGEEFFQPAFEVKVVDTTGAGDVFRGAFVFGLLKKMPLRETARLASAVAALKCTELGGRTGIPTLKQAREFLIPD